MLRRIAVATLIALGTTTAWLYVGSGVFDEPTRVATPPAAAKPVERVSTSSAAKVPEPTRTKRIPLRDEPYLKQTSGLAFEVMKAMSGMSKLRHELMHQARQLKILP